MSPHPKVTEARAPGERGSGKHMHRSYLHMLLFDADQNSVDARLLGSVGNGVCPVLVVLHHCSHWTARR